MVITSGFHFTLNMWLKYNLPISVGSLGEFCSSNGLNKHLSKVKVENNHYGNSKLIPQRATTDLKCELILIAI